MCEIRYNVMESEAYRVPNAVVREVLMELDAVIGERDELRRLIDAIIADPELTVTDSVADAALLAMKDDPVNEAELARIQRRVLESRFGATDV
jgi:DNA-directed RNA polymerase sigma subunit (sigma70/sigma32)